MRSAVAVLALLVVVVTAYADALRPYAGKLVISPDAPPTESSELPAYIKANLAKDGSYPIVKGPPWSLHIVGVLAKDAKTVTLRITEKGVTKAAPLVSIDLVPQRRVIMAHTDATVAAGFANHKTYDVTIASGKTVLARAELVIRD